MNKSKILVVDDTEFIRDLLYEVITQNGYKALVASNTEEALQILNRSSINLVISDIEMPPGPNGIELLKMIKTNWKNIEVIIITGYESMSTAKDALHWEAYDYITKPIDLNKFMNIVEKALEGQRLRRERGKLLTEVEQKNVQLETTVDELNEKRRALDSMVTDLGIALKITQEISRSMVDKSGLNLLTPYMHQLFGCYAWGMLNVNKELEAIEGNLKIFLRYDLPEDKMVKIKEDVINAYQEKYEKLTTINLTVSSQNLIGKAQNDEYNYQINLPMISQKKVYGMAFIYSSGTENFSDKKLHLFSIIVRQLATLKDTILLAEMKELSITDPLTGLNNRREINKHIEVEFYRAQRYKTPFAFGILDIDDFKKVNDTYGHPAGDEVLKQLANVMKTNSRHIDIVGRYGGEEFAFILPNTSFQKAFVFGEKLRKRIAENEFDLGDGRKKQITVSIGVAYFHADSGMDIKLLISNADKALYEAKHSGKNRTCQYVDEA